MTDELLEWVRSRHFGKYRGTVEDNSGDRGRLKVSVPAVLGDLQVWAMPCVPFAGPSVGFFTLPPKGAGVWVEFEGGDPSFPIWSGCFWGDNQLPGEAKSADVKVLETTTAIIKVDDKKKQIVLQVKNGAELTIETGKWVGKKGAAKVTNSQQGVKIEGGAKTVIDVQTSQILIAQ